MRFVVLAAAAACFVLSCGKSAVPPETGPLYPNLTWSAPVSVVGHGKPALVVESARRPDLGGAEVLDFYMDWIGKNGWTTTGPAGGNSAWILTAVSGKEGLQVRFTAHAGYETDSPLDPAGGKVEVTHWLDAPPALLE